MTVSTTSTSSTSSSGVSINSINSLIGTANTSRVSGLASGIDVDSIVAQLMTAESQPLVQMQQQLQLKEWQRDDYRSMNTLLTTLQTNVQTMKLQGSYLAKTAASSNSSLVTATAGVTAGNATYSLSNIEMATSAYNTSTASIVQTGKLDPDAYLSTQAALGSPNSTISFTITTYDQNNNKVDTPFSFDPTKITLNSMMSTISNSAAGVTAFYDSSSGQVSMTRTATGDMNTDVKDGSGNVTTKNPEMQFSGDFLTTTLKMDATQEQGGQDATFTLNGLSTSRHSNTFTMGGVTFNLQGNSTASAPSASITVATDTDAVYKSISDFVDLYNTTISQINDKVDETRNRDYAPLTDTQKASMSASDITSWTAKAQSGMLANDNILTGALSQMRTDLYSSVGSTGSSTVNQLAAIGITTSSNYLDHGKLIISDPDKLKSAISTDPQAFMNLFTNSGTTTNPDGTTSNVAYGSEGIMQRLNTTITNTMNQIESMAGNTYSTDDTYSLGKDITSINDQISAFKTKLQDVETRYYNEFDAMESAIQQSNSQASYLSQLTGG
ncbi:flagellar hook-associated protein 2 [Sporolactobacillus spathodeae]|uniref:Flagellar hook-associated protein 2 n=1 Tax=Sporolactobacillus spathodeae TaxID=1465502 RepID=A0ABS2Q621_9BACL|nr:flagellar hook-associated protein 2 [Sporolactobacillus spathodeae]MBM7657231.1 flagellar hook-associated protein 2 [Sporolactobacillus spathodeae]